MKSIFILTHLLIFVALSGMDPFKKPYESKRILILLGQEGTPTIFDNPYIDGWQTSIGNTEIFVTHANVAHIDGFADIIADHANTQKFRKYQPIECLDNTGNDEYAKRALHVIYTKTLDGMKKQNPNANSIALSSLGTELGFSNLMTMTVATKAIGEFIEKNPTAYGEIILCVKKQSLVTRYIECIENFKEHRILRNLFD